MAPILLSRSAGSDLGGCAEAQIPSTEQIDCEAETRPFPKQFLWNSGAAG